MRMEFYLWCIFEDMGRIIYIFSLCMGECEFNDFSTCLNFYSFKPIQNSGFLIKMLIEERNRLFATSYSYETIAGTK